MHESAQSPSEEELNKVRVKIVRPQAMWMARIASTVLGAGLMLAALSLTGKAPGALFFMTLAYIGVCGVAQIMLANRIHRFTALSLPLAGIGLLYTLLVGACVVAAVLRDDFHSFTPYILCAAVIIVLLSLIAIVGVSQLQRRP